MEEFDIELIAGRSIRGVFAFISRSFVIQAVSFIRDVLLTILLSPAIFGVFYIVESFIGVLSYFSDIGLAGALIQKKDKITQEDLQTTFTIQQVLIISIVIIVLSTSAWISQFFHLSKDGMFLLQAFVVAFFLSSLKTIPSVLLERNLEFGKFVIPQVVETLFYSVTVIVLALKGFGISSFTYAVLVRGVSGLIAMYIVRPWKVQLGFSKESAKSLLAFGVPLQANSILALIKDNLLILFLGRVLPLAQVGYIGFAQKWAFTPLRLVMDNVIRVTFSSFARLQHDRETLGKAFGKSIFAGTLFIFPALVGLTVLSPYFIEVIPRYQKWEPALFSLVFFSLNAALAAILVPFTNLLNAIGKIKITLYLMIFSTAAIWVVTPIAVQIYGYNAVAVVSAAVNLSVFAIWYTAKRYVSVNILRSIYSPLFSAGIMGMVLFITSPFIIKNYISAISMIIAGAFIYFAILLVLDRKQLLSDVGLIKRSILKIS